MWGTSAQGVRGNPMTASLRRRQLLGALGEEHLWEQRQQQGWYWALADWEEQEKSQWSRNVVTMGKFQEMRPPSWHEPGHLRFYGHGRKFEVYCKLSRKALEDSIIGIKWSDWNVKVTLTLRGAWISGEKEEEGLEGYFSHPGESQMHKLGWKL